MGAVRRRRTTLAVVRDPWTERPACHTATPTRRRWPGAGAGWWTPVCSPPSPSVRTPPCRSSTHLTQPCCSRRPGASKSFLDKLLVKINIQYSLCIDNRGSQKRGGHTVIGMQIWHRSYWTYWGKVLNVANISSKYKWDWQNYKTNQSYCPEAPKNFWLRLKIINL